MTTYTSKTFFHNHSQAIRELAEGKELWGENTSQAMKHFYKHVECYWLQVVTNIQIVEHWVKVSNEYTYTGETSSLPA